MISTELRWEIFERDDFRCRSCGIRRVLTIDHIFPRSKGGTDDPENLQTLCWPCNKAKRAQIYGTNLKLSMTGAVISEGQGTNNWKPCRSDFVTEVFVGRWGQWHARCGSCRRIYRMSQSTKRMVRHSERLTTEQARRANAQKEVDLLKEVKGGNAERLSTSDMVDYGIPMSKSA